MPRTYRHLRNLADLAERCTVLQPTGCWEWNGARESQGAPKVWLQGEIGSTSLQVALPMLALGRKAAPGVVYIPTCCKVDCMRWEHRREGTLGELRQIVALARFGRTPAQIAEAIAEKAFDDAEVAARRAQRALAAAQKAAAAQAAREDRAAKKALAAEQRRERERLKKANQRARGRALHDMRDPMGARRGYMPPTIAAPLRKAGSSAAQAATSHSHPIITSATRHVQGPSGYDNRYTVRELPAGYRSQISAAECRPWAAAAVQGRAA